MGQINQDDEEQLLAAQQAPEEADPAAEAAPTAAPEYQPTYAPGADIASLKDAQPKDPKQMVYDSIRAKYADLFKKGQDDVSAAQEKADRNNKFAGIADGIGQIFTARDRARSKDAKWDSSYLNDVRASNKTNVDRAMAKSKAGMDEALQEDQLDWQDKQRGQQQHEWDRKGTVEGQQDKEFDQKQKGWDAENAENTPTSDASKTARAFYAKTFPELATMPGFETASAAMIKKNMFEPLKLQQQIEAQKAEAAARLAQTGQIHEDNIMLHKDALGVKTTEEKKKDVEKYGKTIDPLLKNMNTMAGVESSLGFDLDSYNPKDNTAEFVNPNTGKKIRKEVDLPGTEVPGFGYRPTMALDGDERKTGRGLDSAVSGLLNSKMHENFGARQTDPEVARIEREFQQGGFATREDYLTGLQKYKQGMKRMHQAVSAGFSPDTVATFNGRLPSDIGRYTGSGAPANTPAPTTLPPAAQAALAQASEILADPEAPPEARAKAQAVVDKLKPSK